MLAANLTSIITVYMYKYTSTKIEMLLFDIM